MTLPQLQNHFNSFVFRLEQEEYEREEISWSFVEFPDNQVRLPRPVDRCCCGVLIQIY